MGVNSFFFYLYINGGYTGFINEQDRKPNFVKNKFSFIYQWGYTCNLMKKNYFYQWG